MIITDLSDPHQRLTLATLRNPSRLANVFRLNGHTEAEGLASLEILCGKHLPILSKACRPMPI